MENTHFLSKRVARRFVFLQVQSDEVILVHKHAPGYNPYKTLPRCNRQARNSFLRSASFKWALPECRCNEFFAIPDAWALARVRESACRERSFHTPQIRQTTTASSSAKSLDQRVANYTENTVRASQKKLLLLCPITQVAHLNKSGWNCACSGIQKW